MAMEVGDLVKQCLFDDVYRYGIVTSLDAPERVKRVCAKTDAPIEVYFTPTRSHPVSIVPYAEYVARSLLEVVTE
tara:strand:+ start:327 stop:551 length:225 start_codon:yes stop_codon:yes gene_type:complete